MQELEEEALLLRERQRKEREREQENMRRLLTNQDGRRYILRQLKRAFPLGGGSLCSEGTGTFYNLGKFESYLEILLDLRQAYQERQNEGKGLIGEILVAWFFDSELTE